MGRRGMSQRLAVILERHLRVKVIEWITDPGAQLNSDNRRGSGEDP